jgi:hypothetical protein
MMFQTGNLKSAPPAAKPRPPPQAEPEGGSTLIFGPSPVAKATPPAEIAKPVVAKPAPARPTPAPAPTSTLPEMAPPPRVPPAEESAPEAAAASPSPEPEEAGAPEPELPPAEEPLADTGVEAEGAEPAPEPGTFDKAPPKGLLIGVAAGLALLLVAGGGLVAYRKLARRPPPPAAVETLGSAQADADKDTLASIASAEGKTKDALDVAGPRARFPEGSATLARIEIQWADALTDQAARLGDGDAKAAELQQQATAKAKAAFDVAASALKVKGNESSPDLQLALADYYRFKRSPSMNRYLKNVKDDPRAALIEGMAFLQDEDGAEKAVPRLKAAAAQNPQSARVQFRLAQAYLAVKDDANARAALKETLKLSPQHERAKALLDQLGTASAADRK